MAKSGLEPLESFGDLRRNLIVRGLSAEAVNDMVGHEVRVGSARLFVHRRTVPCKYREAQTKRPGLMNKLWDCCGVNCEILQGGAVSVGDAVCVVPGSHAPARANAGFKPPAFFVKPNERTAEEAAGMVIPAPVAFLMCLVDPAGFQRVEDGYASAGQHFWSPKALEAGNLAKKLRAPLLAATAALAVAVSAKAAARFFP